MKTSDFWDSKFYLRYLILTGWGRDMIVYKTSDLNSKFSLFSLNVLNYQLTNWDFQFHFNRCNIYTPCIYIFQEEFKDLEINIQIGFRVTTFSGIIILAFFLEDNYYQDETKRIPFVTYSHLLSLVQSTHLPLPQHLAIKSE